MRRYDILNYLIRKNNYQKYLEIGIYDGRAFKIVAAKHKDGVDPSPKFDCNYKMTSDDFFIQLPSDFLYDVIFIDGLHTKEQVLKDLKNSLEHLSSNGTIVLHDCNPPNVRMTQFDRSGTVWEAFVEYRMTRPDLFMCVVDTDHGCGIVKRGKQQTISPIEITFDALDKDRHNILNLISTKQFLKEF